MLVAIKNQTVISETEETEWFFEKPKKPKEKEKEKEKKKEKYIILRPIL